MPSNQCTNTLMELSFAVGNMFGAADCDKSDWNQLKDIVDHWECKTTGDAGEELGNMVGFIQDALAQPNTTAGKIEMKDRCVDLFYSHNRLVNSLNLFDQDQLSLQGRGPVPPKLKGPPGIKRDAKLKQLRSSWPNERPKGFVETATGTQEIQVAADDDAGRHTYGHSESPSDSERKTWAKEYQTRKRGGYEGRSMDDGPARGMGYMGDEERGKRWYPGQ